jgi:hypothetical protein
MMKAESSTLQLTGSRRGLLEKLMVALLFKKFPAVCGSGRFITTFIRTPYPEPDKSSHFVF